MARLSLNGSEALAEIKKLIAEINQLKAASKSMSSATQASFNGIEATTNNLRAKVGLLSNKIKYLEAIIRKLNTQVAANTAANQASANAANANATAQNNNATGTNNAARANRGFAVSLSNLIRGGLFLKAAQLAKQLAKNIYENVLTFDSLSYTLQTITKDTFDYENSQRYLLRITEAYGVELSSTTQRWSRFLAAAQESGLALRDTENIFESMTKASSALGLKTDELSSVYLALEQMLSKGKVSTEELRRQLGERLPGAMGIMAASMGVTIPQLDKMLKKGEVLSAEVLPNFAKAVEKAYGIETADRIETLIAKQNRLGAAWQMFVKNVSEGDGVIRKALSWFFDMLTETANLWDKMLRTADQQLRVDISVNETKFAKSLQSSSDRFVDFVSDIENTDIALNFKEGQINEQLKTASGDVRTELLADLDEIARARIVKDDAALARSREIAKENINLSYLQYKEAKRNYKAIEDEFKRVKEGQQVKSSFNQDQKDEAYAELVRLESQYNVYRKLVEESEVSFIPNEDEVAKTQKRLRAIKDYSLEIINEIAGYVKDSNLELFQDETIDLKPRLEALKKATAQELLIKENLLTLTKNRIEDSYEAEIKSGADAVAKGSLSRTKYNDFLVKLEKEKNQQLVLETQKTGFEMAEINRKAAESINNLSTKTLGNQRVDNVEDIFSKRTIAAKKAYNESKKTAKDQADLERELAQITIDSTNEIIDVKISLLKEEARVLQESGRETSEYVEKLQQEIAKLEATKQVQPPLDRDEWQSEFEAAMEMAGEFNDAISSLSDAAFDRKIENINAEIEAEEAKYDRLIALAEGDEEQQATLERNKQDRIAKLEKERLKQQQKQAKANKAFAIADIAINTAVAISKTLATGGAIFGIPLVPIIAALGALQTAAVLAAPIPQYKDGVENLGQNEMAIINDGGVKEYVERNGRILATDKKNALVNLKKGDTVYKNYDEMANRSSILKIRNRAIIERANNDRLLKDVTGAVVNGFKKAKITNNINLRNTNKDSGYAARMSRWN